MATKVYDESKPQIISVTEVKFRESITVMISGTNENGETVTFPKIIMNLSEIPVVGTVIEDAPTVREIPDLFDGKDDFPATLNVSTDPYPNMAGPAT